MEHLLWLLLLIPLVVWFKYRKQRLEKRDVLLHQSLPEASRKLIKKNVPFYAMLAPELQARIDGYVQLFLAEKVFEGCGGQEIDEEIRLTIAAEACLLLIGRKDAECYPGLKTILVYPHSYVSGKSGILGGDNGAGARLGESWDNGVVVLSWNSVQGGARNMEDGHNVTLHEFAHQLDQDFGPSDGAPRLAERSAYGTWAKVLGEEYAELCKKTQQGRRSTIDSYGATNPAEFFAVATETFFEKPEQLKKHHLELYDELQSYYGINPEEWQQAAD